MDSATKMKLIMPYVLNLGQFCSSMVRFFASNWPHCQHLWQRWILWLASGEAAAGESSVSVSVCVPLCGSVPVSTLQRTFSTLAQRRLSLPSTAAPHEACPVHGFTTGHAKEGEDEGKGETEEEKEGEREGKGGTEGEVTHESGAA